MMILRISRSLKWRVVEPPARACYGRKAVSGHDLVVCDPIRRDDPQTDDEIARWLTELKPIGVIETKVDA